MGDLGPLGGSDVLAHVDDAVHGYIRVGLYQTGAHTSKSITLVYNLTCCKSVVNTLTQLHGFVKSSL